MKRTRLWLLAIAGVLLPAALAFAAFMISSGLDASANSPAVTPQIVRDNSRIASQSEDLGKGEAKETPAAAASPTDEHSGRCSEPEHATDPSCTSGSSTSGSSGSGDDHGGSGSGTSAGSGSTSGGSGGSDDGSGSTSGGSGSSGSSGSSRSSGSGGDDTPGA